MSKLQATLMSTRKATEPAKPGTGHRRGASYTHDAPDRLLMAMIWLRVYPTYDVLGFIFDLHKSNIGRNMKPILVILPGHRF